MFPNTLKLQERKWHVSLNLEGDFKIFDSWLWHWQKRLGISQISIFREAKFSYIQVAAEIH